MALNALTKIFLESIQCCDDRSLIVLYYELLCITVFYGKFKDTSLGLVMLHNIVVFARDAVRTTVDLNSPVEVKR